MICGIIQTMTGREFENWTPEQLGFQALRELQDEKAISEGAVRKPDGRLDFSEEPFVLAKAKDANEVYPKVGTQQKETLRRIAVASATRLGETVVKFIGINQNSDPTTPSSK
jgi:hypothetical protein